MMSPNLECVQIDLGDRTLSQVLMEVERLYLETVLTKACGNKTLAAKIAGVSLSTFREKLSRFTVKMAISLE